MREGGGRGGGVGGERGIEGGEVDGGVEVGEGEVGGFADEGGGGGDGQGEESADGEGAEDVDQGEGGGGGGGTEEVFPMVGKTGADFSNDWKNRGNFFQWLEKTGGGFPTIGKNAGAGGHADLGAERAESHWETMTQVKVTRSRRVERALMSGGAPYLIME